MTTTIVFPDISQWGFRTGLRYLSAKLHRKKVEVCGGKNDDRTLQSIIDGSSDTYKLEAGQFYFVPPMRVNNTHIQGASPQSKINCIHDQESISLHHKSPSRIAPNPPISNEGPECAYCRSPAMIKIKDTTDKCGNCGSDFEVMQIEVVTISISLCPLCRRYLISELQIVTDEEPSYEDPYDE